MNYPPEQAELFLEQAAKVLQEPVVPEEKLKKLWWTLVFLRSACLSRDLKNVIGNEVFSGPFKGMKLSPESMAANYAPHLLGSYEHELHATMERVIADGYDRILNIGSSFGYYSVGLAKRMPQVKVDAFDISEDARNKCRGMALFNNVADRVTINGEFKGEDFAKYAGQKTLALVDIESAEINLLDPARYPALKNIDVIVELHDLMNPTISKTIIERFKPTHDCELVRNMPMLFPFEQIFGDEMFIDPFDRFIASWDMRDGQTPWGVFRVKKP